MKFLTEAYLNTLRGLGDTDLEIGPSGNVSFRDGEDIYITPTGATFGDTLKTGLSRSELNGDVVEGPKPSSDLAAHKVIYQSRQDIKAIVHTHSHYVTVMAALGKNLPIITTMQADYIGKSIDCVPFSNHRTTGYGDTGHFVHGNYFLLGKHGGLVLFSDVDSGVISKSMRAFEEVCRLHYDILIASKLTKIESQPILEDEVLVINNYYQTAYGNN